MMKLTPEQLARGDSLRPIPDLMAKTVVEFFAQFDPLKTYADAKCLRCGKPFTYRKHGTGRPKYCTGCARYKPK